MKRILSFGGGLQTTALAVLAYRREVRVDGVVFADPGAEKPETYWFIQSYIMPLFKEARIPFKVIIGNNDQKRNLVEHCKYYRVLPSVVKRWCTEKHKMFPILKELVNNETMLVGFSLDEQNRAERARGKERKAFPLIELGLTSADCRNIISDFGWPIPVKSSCYFCPFQRWPEWNWLKLKHPELIAKAVNMEMHFYTRRPDLRERIGLFGGEPLWRWQFGIQQEMPLLKEYSCWSGHCGH